MVNLIFGVSKLDEGWIIFQIGADLLGLSQNQKHFLRLQREKKKMTTKIKSIANVRVQRSELPDRLETTAKQEEFK